MNFCMGDLFKPQEDIKDDKFSLSLFREIHSGAALTAFFTTLWNSTGCVQMSVVFVSTWSAFTDIANCLFTLFNSSLFLHVYFFIVYSMSVFNKLCSLLCFLGVDQAFDKSERAVYFTVVFLYKSCCVKWSAFASNLFWLNCCLNSTDKNSCIKGLKRRRRKLSSGNLQSFQGTVSTGSKPNMWIQFNASTFCLSTQAGRCGPKEISLNF